MGFGALFFGNMFILPRINNFKSDFAALWELCNCPEFEQKYSISRKMYEYATYAIGSICVIQIIISIIYFCKAEQQQHQNSTILPINVNTSNIP